MSNNSQRQIIKNAQIVTDGRCFEADLMINQGRIEKIDSAIGVKDSDIVIEADGDYLLPGMIDDQVHFREPGLTHKGSIYTESRAAVAGGITSFMEMPNVKPSTTTVEALDEKFEIARQNSLGNYSFYLGATEDNLDQIKAVDPNKICGVKVFMGASTGDLLVEHPAALDGIFRESPVMIVTHCEDSRVINSNLTAFKQQGKEPLITDHHIIRSVDACYQSSSYAVNLAKKYQSQLHVLHITTAKELGLFTSGPIETKHITAEACVHHLWFSEKDYPRLGNQIKCNPAIKTEEDRLALLKAVNDNIIDIIATDHAPHTLEEKQVDYGQAPAGLPLVEHALLTLMDQVKNGAITLEKLVEKVAHNPAIRYKIAERGFIREGYFADLTLVSATQPCPVTPNNTRYKCQWTPFAGHTFSSKILSTWVNGFQVFDGTHLQEHTNAAMPLAFNRV